MFKYSDKINSNLSSISPFIISLLLYYILSKTTGNQNLYNFTILTVNISIFSSISSLGLNTYIIRFYSKYKIEFFRIVNTIQFMLNFLLSIGYAIYIYIFEIEPFVRFNYFFITLFFFIIGLKNHYESYIIASKSYNRLFIYRSFSYIIIILCCLLFKKSEFDLILYIYFLSIILLSVLIVKFLKFKVILTEKVKILKSINKIFRFSLPIYMGVILVNPILGFMFNIVNINIKDNKDAIVYGFANIFKNLGFLTLIPLTQIMLVDYKSKYINPINDINLLRKIGFLYILMSPIFFLVISILFNLELKFTFFIPFFLAGLCVYMSSFSFGLIHNILIIRNTKINLYSNLIWSIITIFSFISTYKSLEYNSILLSSILGYLAMYIYLISKKNDNISYS